MWSSVGRFEAEVGGTDPDHVPRLQPAGLVETVAVDEGAVRRAHVLDPDAVAPWLDPRVPRGGVVVVVEGHVVRGASADRERSRVEHSHLALAERGTPHDDEPGRLAAARSRGPAAALRRDDHA